MKKILLIILVIQSIFASAEGRISLKCELDEKGLIDFENSKFFKRKFLEYLKLEAFNSNEEYARAAALSYRLIGLEFELTGIELDKDVNNIFSLEGARMGEKYEWSPQLLSYTKLFLEENYLATINREDLSYLSFVFDNLQNTKEYFTGKCEVLKFKPKF